MTHAHSMHQPMLGMCLVLLLHDCKLGQPRPPSSTALQLTPSTSVNISQLSIVVSCNTSAKCFEGHRHARVAPTDAGQQAISWRAGALYLSDTQMNSLYPTLYSAKWGETP